MKDGGSFERAEEASTCGRALTEPCKRMHFWVLSFAGSWSRHRHTPPELGWGGGWGLFFLNDYLMLALYNPHRI